MKNLPSSAFSIEWKSVLTGFVVAIITAALTSLALALGLNPDGTMTLPHIPTKADLIKALIAGISGGLGYIIQKFIKNDVPAAVATIQKAEEKQIDNIKA